MKKIALSLTILFAGAVCAVAQTSLSTFFSDNSIYSYRINPAIAGEKGFVGFALNNIGIDVNSNLSVGALLYPSKNGGLVTFLNNEVSYADAMKRFKNYTGLTVNENISLLSFGWWTKHGYFNTVDVNVRSTEGIGLPKSLFALMKDGSSPLPYNLSSMRVGADAYLEVAYGISKQISDKISFGARVKFLGGLARATATFDKAEVTINDEVVSYNVNGTLKIAAPMFSFGSKESSFKPGVPVIDFTKLQMGKLGLGGYGGAIDLGITYKPIKDLTLSLAVLDLGATYWNYSALGRSVGTNSFGGMDMTVTPGGQNDAVQKEFEEFMQGLASLLEFETVEDKVSNSLELMPVTVNAGLRYRMPFYNRWSVGALAQYRYSRAIGHPHWYDFRAGMTITPIDWFSLSGNYGYNASGLVWGGMLSLNVASINIFCGVEGYSGRVGRLTFSDVPILNRTIAFKYPLGAFRYSLNFGFTITFGDRHNEFPARKKKKAE